MNLETKIMAEMKEAMKAKNEPVEQKIKLVLRVRRCHAAKYFFNKITVTFQHRAQ